MANVVENPACKSIALQFLLAHAEQPSLLKSASNPKLRTFAEEEPFLNEFIENILDKMPHYTEEKLLDTKSWMSQQDYQDILNVFKDMTGIHNPLHYRELGRIIPSIGDALPQLASTAAGPDWVIRLSPRYNSDFNNDQEIIIESLSKSGYEVQATIQHYFLPRQEDNPPYFEMVSAALGYWEGIPLLWGWPIFGETKLCEVQIPLEQLVQKDYKYLNLQLEEQKDGTIIIDDQAVGQRKNLHKSENILTYKPQENFLDKDLSEYLPIVMTNDFRVDGEVIFPKGTLYGMPCNRYEVTIPKIGHVKSLWYAIRLAAKTFQERIFHSDKQENKYRVLVRRPSEAVLSETLYAARFESEQKLLAEKNEAEARAEAAEAELAFQEEVGGINTVMGSIYHIVHDEKNARADLRDAGFAFLQSSVKEAKYSPPIREMFDDEEKALEGIEAIISDPKASLYIRNLAQHTKIQAEELSRMIQEDRILMQGGVPLKMENISYGKFMKEIVDSFGKRYRLVDFRYIEPEKESVIVADRRKLTSALKNLVQNAAQASSDNFQKNNYVQVDQSFHWDEQYQTTYSTIWIVQSADIPPKLASKLNKGTQESTKKEGSNVGLEASRTIITKSLKGTLEFYSKDDIEFEFPQYAGAGGVTEIGL